MADPYSDVPLSLLLRSEGDINVNNNIHAGTQLIRAYRVESFFGAFETEARVAPVFSESGDIQLTAGADFSSSDSKTVNKQGVGDIIVAQNKSVIAGSGSIDLHAGGDISLQDSASIKTIGFSEAVDNIQVFPPSLGIIGTDEAGNLLALMPDAGTLPFSNLIELFPNSSQFGNGEIIYFASNGGDISINAGGDITGNGVDQLSTAWRYRLNGDEQLGAIDRYTKNITAWGIVYDNFSQGVGTLGGGDISVVADGNVSNLLLAAPTVGKQTGSNPVDGQVAVNEVEVTGGGDISVIAGESVNTTSYLASQGDISVVAGDQFGRVSNDAIVARVTYGNSDISFKASSDVEINGAIPEFMVPLTDDQSFSIEEDDSFNAWVDEVAINSLSLESIRGDVILDVDSRPSANIFESLFLNNFIRSDLYGTSQNNLWPLFALLPQSVSAVANRGSIELRNSVYLLPSPDNAVTLLADEDITARVSDLELVVNNLGDEFIPTQANPAKDFASVGTSNSSRTPGYFQLLAGQVVPPSADGVEPTLTGSGEITLIASQGDIEAETLWELVLGKESYLEAGDDLVDLELRLQNNNDTDISKVLVGDDIIYNVSRDQEDGTLNKTDGIGIFVEGPGSLLVQAGNDIELGASDGIISLGNIENSALAEQGADLFVLAGINEDPALDDYLVPAAFKNFEFTLDDIRNAGIAESSISTADASVPDYLADLIDPASVSSASERAYINLSKNEQIQVANYLFDQANLDTSKALYVYQSLLNEVRDAGREQLEIQAAIAAGEEGITNDDFNGYSRSYAAIDTLFPGSSEGTGTWDGNVSFVFSTLQTKDGGDIHFLVPGGSVDVGLPTTLVDKDSSQLGIIASGVDSSIYGFVDKNVNVNQSRVFALDGGDIMMWASNGDIDAGKGAKTALAVPPPRVEVKENGDIELVFPPAIDGSGIGSFFTPGNEPGNIDLFAPRGIIDAGDAGIRAGGDLNLGSDTIVNADNIDVGGTAVGVPVSAGTSAAVSGLGGLTESATDSATESATGGVDTEQSQTAFLTVEIIGLGE